MSAVENIVTSEANSGRVTVCSLKKVQKTQTKNPTYARTHTCTRASIVDVQELYAPEAGRSCMHVELDVSACALASAHTHTHTHTHTHMFTHTRARTHARTHTQGRAQPVLGQHRGRA